MQASPNKLGENNDLMNMIKECSKNIEKIEVKNSGRKHNFGGAQLVTSINLDTP